MHVGRTKMVLVFGEGGDATAVISEVIAHVRKDGGEEHIRFEGPVAFEPDASNCIREGVIPLIDQIMDNLCLARSNFDISIKNLGVASVTDQSFQVGGYSADIPVFLALFSAALQLPLPRDIVSTGHIASKDGDISVVRAIPEKLKASIMDGNIRRFIYPALDSDRSLAALAPSEHDRIQESLLEAKGKIQCVAVTDIADLFQVISTDEAIVSASLSAGYFGLDFPPSNSDSPVGRIVQQLLLDQERRFGNILERYLLAGDDKAAKSLLLARVRHEIRRGDYPEGFGRRLQQLVGSRPPATRRIKIASPLIPLAECLELGRLAADVDAQDVRWLIAASSGDYIPRRAEQATGEDLPLAAEDKSVGATLDLVLTEISDEHLTETIDIPIDTARATYVMDSVRLESMDEFHGIITAFYMHLLRHARSISSSASPAEAGHEAYALLERAYAEQGGADTAITKALTGTQGGIRCVLDTMTDQFKREEREKHVQLIFKVTLGSRNWDFRVALMEAFLRRIAPQLPPEIRTESPERYAHDYEAIARLWAKSIETVKRRLSKW
ncbi:MAG: hypothetical protein ABIH23_26930 [bacterium]